MNRILVIDQSTSATKALLFDSAGCLGDQVAQDHRQIYPRPTWVEHDAEEIWANTLAVVRTLLERNAQQVQSIQSLSITNQRETILIFDRRTGRPLYNAMVWQCRRGDSICRQLSGEGGDEMVRKKTGLTIDTYFSASKLKWLLREKPELAEKLKSGEALVGTMDTYLIYRLTGGAVFATDHTNASRTLLFDVGKLCWDEELCRMFDVPIPSLAEVRESFSRFGDTDVAGALPRPIPICGVMGDSQAALFAQRCYQPGQAKATFGTGTSVLLNIGHEWRLSDNGAVSALAWVHEGQATYAFEGLINYSAATITWLKNQLGLIADESEIDAIIATVEDNGGVYLVPAFAGLSAPHAGAEARAAILGMTAFTTRGHIVRAALESIAYQMRDVLEMMRVGTEYPPQTLQVDGGPTKNSFLMQFIADITGMELEASDVRNASALGVALAGFLGMGVFASFKDIRAISRNTVIYRARMDMATSRSLYEGWQEAVKRILLP